MVKLYLGEIWHVVETTQSREGIALETFSKGALLVDEQGTIQACGDASPVLKEHPSAEIIDFSGKIIIPGFIDMHLHMPQLDIVGSFGESLLGWLDKYTFPHEIKCKDTAYSQASSRRLFQLLFTHGTTTSVIFAATYKNSAEACFQVARDLGARAVIGKVAMDRNAPKALCQDVGEHISDEADLIARWHGVDNRLFYALTPRFAPSTSPELLEALGELRQENPNLYVQTHLAENKEEILWVKKLFPAHSSYLDVYHHYGLLGERSIFAHAIHLSPREYELFRGEGGKIAHCPSSNAFLGSGFFPVESIRNNDISFGLGSDIGAGTSFSMWQTMLICYQLQKLIHASVSPSYLLNLSTLAGAKCLGLSNSLGNFMPGKCADFQVLDPEAGTPLLKDSGFCDLSSEEKLFRLITLGDDRITRQVFVSGRQVLNKEAV